MNLSEIRQKYPQYNDMSDDQFADAFYNKFYSDMDREAFNQKLGTSKPQISGLNELSAAGRKVLKGVSGGVLTNVIPAELAAAATYGLKKFDPNDNPTYGEARDFAYKVANRDLNQFDEKHPILGPVLEGAGAVGGGLLGAGLTGKAGQAAANTIRTGLLPNATGLLGKGANLASKSVLGGAATATTLGAYGAGTEQTGDFAKGFKELAPMGLAIGAGTPVAGAAVSGLGKAVSPVFKPAIDDAKAAIVPLAQKYNIPLGLDDITSSDFYKTLIDEGGKKPFSGAQKQAEVQFRAFTRAAAKEIGLEDVDALTPEAMEKAYKQIGSQFDDLTKGKSFTVADDVLKGLEELELAVRDNAFGTDGAAAFNRITQDLFESMDSKGVIQGDRLASIRGRLNKIGRSGSNPDVKALASELENAVVDIIGDKGALGKAKYQYKNFLALEPLAQKSSVDGIISPAQLNNRVRAIYKRQATIGNAGGLGDLAKIGQVIKQQIPNSGTAQRNAVNKLLSPGLDVGAAAAGLYNPLLPALYFGGKGAGVLANRAIQSRNFNPKLMENLLSNAPKKSNSALFGLKNGIMTGNSATLPTR